MAVRVANVALACGSALALLVFVYFFYWYSVTGQRQFTSPFYVVVYYLMPLILAAALLAALRLQPVHKMNVLMLLVASGMAFYAMELFLTWRASSLYGRPLPVMTILEDSSDRQADAAALGKQWGTQVDPRSAGEVLDALRPAYPDAVPIMTFSNQLWLGHEDGSVTSAIEVDGHEVVPLGAISNRVTVLCNESGQWVQYQSDSHGFNNPTEAWVSGPVEIAALGDSFTHGYCVPPGQNFVALIRQRHSATLNLGMAGDGPLMMLAKLTEYLTSLKPRLVLWFYFEGNDLDNLRAENKSAVLRSYLQDGYTQQSLMQQDDIDRAMLGEIPRLKAEGERLRTQRLNRPVTEALTNFAKLSMLRQQLGLVGGVAPGSTGPDERDMELFRDVLLQARTRVERWGGRLVFVYLPDWDRYAGNTTLQAAKRGEVIDTARGLGIPVIDGIDSAFLAHGDPLSLFPFRRPGHYNAAGHRIVAEVVLEALPTITGTN